MPRKSLWAFCALLAAAGVPGVQAVEDTTPPQLVSLSFNPTSVDVTGGSATVTVTAHLHDDLSGVFGMCLAFISPDRSRSVSSCSYSFQPGGSALDGTYQAEVLVPQYVPAGTWTLEIQYWDKVNNYVALNTEALRNLGWPTDLTVISTSDTSAPVLAGLSFSPTTVDVTSGSATVTVAVHLTDDLSGVFGVCLAFISPDRSRSVSSCSYAYRPGESPLDGTYQADVLIPRYVPSGIWTLEIQYWDKVNNYVALNTDALRGLGWPTDLTVVSTPDSNAPVLVGLSFSPAAIDTSAAPATVTVLAHLTDDVAGVFGICGAFISPDRSRSNSSCSYVPRTGGSDLDGVYELGILFPQYSMTGTWTLELQYWDRANNYLALNTADLQQRQFPTDLFNGRLSIPVTIDIKPGGSPNSINLKSQGTIPVAIFSDASFDAPGTIDTASLTFGRTGSEASLAFCNRGGEDVNGDGRLDLVCHFNVQNTGFQAGDTVGVLKGKTLTGTGIVGSDSVRIVP